MPRPAPTRRAALLLPAAAALAAPRAARAQPRGMAWHPDRPVTLITGYAPGGSTDVAARLIAEPIAAALTANSGAAPGTVTPARILVDNRPGAAGTVATEWLRRQPADGLTLMVQETGAGAAAPAAVVGGTRYDPVEDFTPIGLISTPPEVLVVTPSFPGRTAAETLARMREAAPESLTYATSGVGGVLHLKAEMLARALGTRFVHVPYRSGAQMVTSIMQGDAQWGIAALASAAPFIRDGKVRPVAVLGARRFPVFPDIPTLAEAGVPGFESGGWFMLIGPAGIPRPAVEALNAALVAALRDPGTRERLLNAGHDPVQGENTPEGARAFLVKEVAALREMVERTGVRLQG